MTNSKANGQQVTDEEIAVAVVESRTMKEAAEKCRLSPRQLYERRLSRELNARISWLRAEQLRARLCALEDAQAVALQCIVEIMQDTENAPETRLKAAAAVLNAGSAACNEIIDIERKAFEQAKRIDIDKAFDSAIS